MKSELELNMEYQVAGEPGSKPFDDTDVCCECGKCDSAVNAAKNTQAMFKWVHRDNEDMLDLVRGQEYYLCGECTGKHVDKLGFSTDGIVGNLLIENGVEPTPENIEKGKALLSRQG